MYRVSTINFAVLCLAVTSLSQTTLAVEVPEVSGPPIYPFVLGEERKTKRLRDGEERIQVTRLIDDNTGETECGDGCSWTFSRDDAYGPNLSWTKCSKGPWGTGTISDLKKQGQLWPFKVGNKASYRYTAVNAKGKKNKKVFRECEVSGTEMVKAVGQEYASYRVDCKEHTGTRTYFYAPSIQNTVHFERIHKKRGKQTMEFLEHL